MDVSCYLCGFSGFSQSDGCELKQCEGCQNVEFCSDACKRFHNSPPDCYPFRVESNEECGRFVVATRDIQPLEVLMIDHPVVVCPQSLTVCLVCLKQLQNPCFYPCSACNMPMCSDLCGQQHQLLLPEECGLLSRLPASQPDVLAIKECIEERSQNLIYSMVGTLRLLLSVEQSRSASEENRGFDLSDWIGKLLDHRQHLKEDPVIMNHLRRVVHLIRNELGLGSKFSEDLVEHCYGVLRVNSFGTCSWTGGNGRALYPIAALFSHSCRANAHHSNERMSDANSDSGSYTGRFQPMVITAQRDIKAGQEITIRYVDNHQGSYWRRQYLKSTWYFDCLCARCEDASECGTFTSAISCPQCASSATLLLPSHHFEQPLSCSVCQYHTSHSHIQSIETEAMSKWNHLIIGFASLFSGVESADLARCEDLLSHLMNQVLSKEHYLIIRMKKQLAHLYEFQAAEDTQQHIRALQRRQVLWQDLIHYLQAIDPGQSQLMAVYLIEYNRCQVNLAKINLQQGLMSKRDFLLTLKQAAKLQQASDKIMQAPIYKRP